MFWNVQRFWNATAGGIYRVYLLLFLMLRTYTRIIHVHTTRIIIIIIITRQWSENDTPSLIDNRALWGLHTQRDVYSRK